MDDTFDLIKRLKALLREKKVKRGYDDADLYIYLTEEMRNLNITPTMNDGDFNDLFESVRRRIWAETKDKQREKARNPTFSDYEKFESKLIKESTGRTRRQTGSDSQAEKDKKYKDIYFPDDYEKKRVPSKKITFIKGNPTAKDKEIEYKDEIEERLLNELQELDDFEKYILHRMIAIYPRKITSPEVSQGFDIPERTVRFKIDKVRKALEAVLPKMGVEMSLYKGGSENG